MKKALSLLLCFVFFSIASAQVKLSEKVAAPFISINAGAQLPAGNIQKYFGPNFSLGLDVLYKTKKNILFGAYGHFIFGGSVKYDSLLRGIATQEGFILNQNGQYGTVRLYERGMNLGLRTGMIFPILGSNPNSGIMITAGIGLLQYKIRIETLLDDIPQLSTAYKKGYDRLTNGLNLNEFIGYFNLDNRKRLNYYFGFELNQAFTKNRRDYNFDTESKDDRLHYDFLNGFRIGFIIPFYAKVPNDYYYN